MKNSVLRKVTAVLSAVSIFAIGTLSIAAASWIDPLTDIRSPLTAKEVPVTITDVARSFGNVCFDLQNQYPTSLYQVYADGRKHYAICVAASHNTPGNGGKAYRMDISGLSQFSGMNSHLLEASANLTSSDGTYTIWEEAFRDSDLSSYNDEQILRKIAWMVNDGHWVYYPLAKTYTAASGNLGVELDFNSPIEATGIYRDLVVSTDAMSRYKAFNISSNRVGKSISGLYGAAHAIASRMITGERYHLSGTLYYSFTRTEQDKATYTYGSHSAFAYGDNGNGNQNYTYRKIQLMQYMNIIAHAPEYSGDLYLYSPDQRSGDGQQWLLYVDSQSDYIGKESYVIPAVMKNTSGDNRMTGAVFTFYSDESLSTVAGTLKDNDGDGIYTDYTNSLNGANESSSMIHLTNRMNGSYDACFYVKETEAPDHIIGCDGGIVPLYEDIKDENTYKVAYSYDLGSRTLATEVYNGDQKVYGNTFYGYDGLSSPEFVYLGNNANADFTDGSGLCVLKETSNGYTVTNTVFTLFKGDNIDGDALAYYRYSDGWNWFTGKSDGSVIGSSYPVLKDSTYTIVEEYVPDTYADTGIPYTVRNESGWKFLSENRYSYTFDTTGLGSGDEMTVIATNDRQMSGVTVSKSSDDGNIAGVTFDIDYLGNGNTPSDASIHAVTAVTDENGIATADSLPLGWYSISENVSEGYAMTWQDGTSLRGDSALVHLTSSSSADARVCAYNRVSTVIAAVKKDVITGEYLKGATFRLYKDLNGNGVLDGDEKNNYSSSTDTDNDGIALFFGVGIGSYIVEEANPPLGYYLSDKNYPVTVSGLPQSSVEVNGQTISAYVIEAFDEPYQVPVHIVKNDSRDENAKLSGAYFEIYEDTDGNGSYDPETDQIAKTYIDGSLFDVKIIERNGRYETTGRGLRPGTYFVVEHVAPEMYIGSSEVKTVVIDPVDTTSVSTPVPVTVVFVNEMSFETTLTSDKGDKIPEYSDSSVITDIVRYTNLIAGRTYTLTGELVIRDGSENGDSSYTSTGITGITTFTPEDDGTGVVSADGTIRVSGTAEVQFVVDVTKYKGCILVAFETLRHTSVTIAVHADINDRAQTIYVPDLGTEFTDRETGTHTVTIAPDTVLVDTVRYENLVPGTEYVITGRLINKETGEEITDRNGDVITAERTFVADSSVGTVDVSFTVDTTELPGRQIVAFEELWFEDTLIAEHADPEDGSQTVGVHELITRATGGNGDKYVMRDTNVRIVDSVRYSNLTPGERYIIEGTLIDVSTGETVKDSNNNALVSRTLLIPDEPDGIVEVPFEFDGSSFSEGNKIVVFEEAYMVTGSSEDEKVLICSHCNPSNREQTVTFKRDVPKTGEDSNASDLIYGTLALAGTVISAAGIIVVLSKRRKGYDT